MNSKTKSLLEVTGRSLKNRMAMWEGKKHRAPFEENIPCKLQVIIEKTLQILGEFKACLENESIALLWRKRHFQNAHNRWRSFPPRRDVYVAHGTSTETTQTLRLPAVVRNLKPLSWLFQPVAQQRNSFRLQLKQSYGAMPQQSKAWLQIIGS
jgi:hypothetical protein